LPKDLQAAVFVAIHIDPKAERKLIDVLQKYSEMPMRYPVDEEYYVPSTVYVAPPGYHMLLSYRKVWVFPANFVYLPKPNIDLMLQSAANEFGSSAIGIIISGHGTDGAIGMKAIKEKGGTTIIQSVDTAEASGMPEAAIESGLVDYIIPANDDAVKTIELIIKTLADAIIEGNQKSKEVKAEDSASTERISKEQEKDKEETAA